MADEIVVFGKINEEHDRNMHAMLKRFLDTAKAKPDNCFVSPEMIKFYEVMSGQDGIQPDPIKISALKQMPPPTNHQELQIFLGIENYMGPIIPKLKTTDSSRLRGVPHLLVRPTLYRLH